MSETPPDSPPQPIAPIRRKKRLRLSFSLRMLFVVVTVFGVWLGWQANIVRVRKQLLGELKERQPTHWYETLESLETERDFELDAIIADRQYARIPLMRRFMGDETIIEIDFVGVHDLDWIARVEHAFPESVLYAKHSLVDTAFRDSLYKPLSERQPNRGNLFKTGLIAKP